MVENDAKSGSITDRALNAVLPRSAHYLQNVSFHLDDALSCIKEPSYACCLEPSLSRLYVVESNREKVVTFLENECAKLILNIPSERQ